MNINKKQTTVYTLTLTEEEFNNLYAILDWAEFQDKKLEKKTTEFFTLLRENM